MTAAKSVRRNKQNILAGWKGTLCAFACNHIKRDWIVHNAQYNMERNIFLMYHLEINETGFFIKC